VGCVGHEGRRDVPGVRAGVCDAVYDSFDWNDIGGWAAKEEEGDVALSGRRPGDVVGRASWNELAESGMDDRIA